MDRAFRIPFRKFRPRTESNRQPHQYNQTMPDRLPWIAQAPASLRLLELAEKVAVAPTTLLITGESGSGKDYLARLIHELGPRRDAPYLKIDCAALPPDLVESELFGHERGAFTGAAERKLGRLELGGAGTIVLDEVAALSPTTQTKLLRVLQERAFERLGGTETLRIEARLIALTNVDLNAAVSAGRFREDLFFRLSVLPLGVPPLRERREDILPLADHLFALLGAIHNRPNWKLTEATRSMLVAYAWPGNIRELRNALERAIVFGKGPELTPNDFSENVRAAAGGAAILSGLRSLEQVERDVIAQTLEATRYHISKSAEILGISRKTLLEKRKKYGLE
jgi:DNA-binding NtrC family response regulator